jgi:predicted dehydrogenase
MSRPLQVAVIGVGRWGAILARAVSEIEQAKVVVLCDSSLARLAPVAAELRVSRASEIVDDALADDVDAVVIATPPETHAELARRAVEAGKHVFVEKPLATSLADGLALERAATRAGRLVMAGHLLRFHEGVAKLRTLVNNGDLGRIELAVSRRLGWRNADRCGPWWSLAPHDLSVLRGILGTEPEHVAAAAALPPAITSWNPVKVLFSGSTPPRGTSVPRCPIRVMASASFRGGIPTVIDVGLLDNSKMRKVLVVGRRAIARFEDGPDGGVWTKPFPSDARLGAIPAFDQPATLEELQHVVERTEELAEKGEPWSLVASGWQEPLRLEMRQFVAACGNLQLARVEMDDALAILRALEAGTRSMREGGRSVRVPGPVPTRNGNHDTSETD